MPTAFPSVGVKPLRDKPAILGNHVSPFQGRKIPTYTLGDDVIDAFVAIAVAATVSTVVLWLFGLIVPGMPASEVIGKIAVQTFPGSLGAILARSQLGQKVSLAIAAVKNLTRPLYSQWQQERFFWG